MQTALTDMFLIVMLLRTFIKKDQQPDRIQTLQNKMFIPVSCSYCSKLCHHARKAHSNKNMMNNKLQLKAGTSGRSNFLFRQADNTRCGHLIFSHLKRESPCNYCSQSHWCFWGHLVHWYSCFIEVNWGRMRIICRKSILTHKPIVGDNM